MYLFSKYNYYFRYYVIDGYYFVIIIMRIPSDQVFALFMIFDWLISIYFFVCSVFSHWVWISMNHTLPHPLMMTPPLSFIYTFLRKEWAQISMNHIPGQFHHYTFTFRDFKYCHMGVSESSTFNQEVMITTPDKRFQ